MFKGERVLALIPARSGSKGLPGKNLTPVGGVPLVVWSVAAGIGSTYVDDVVLTSDDSAVIDIATAAGAEAPFVRSPELASDTARMSDVILDALDRLEAEGRTYGYLVLLQPTSPLRVSADIDAAFARLDETGGSAVVAVSPAEHSPLLMNTLPGDGSLDRFLSASTATANRQELATYYRVNGAVYVATVSRLRSGEGFIGEGAFAYVMPPERSVDIDTRVDMLLAEALLAERADSSA